MERELLHKLIDYALDDWQHRQEVTAGACAQAIANMVKEYCETYAPAALAR